MAAQAEALELSAPGKLFLAGEYAVLDGGQALVAAVDRTLRARLMLRATGEPVALHHGPTGAHCELGAPPPPALRFAARAVSLALRLCDEEGLASRGFALHFDNEFSQGGEKLGFGGSAAACVLAVRATALACGRRLTAQETAALASAAHWIEQGGAGSCADVAACALGGLVSARFVPRFRSAAEAQAAKAGDHLRAPLVSAQVVPLPDDLRLLAVFSGASADSRALVAAVRAWAQRDPAGWRLARDRLDAASRELLLELRACAESRAEGPRKAALQQVSSAAGALAELGRAAGVSLVTPELGRAVAASVGPGRAGKPSGAGGGDCAVVLAFGDAAADEADAALRVAGFSPLRLQVAAARP